MSENAIVVGSVAVDVHPDTSRFSERARRQITPEAERLGRQLSERITAPMGDQIRATVSTAMRTAGATAARDGERAGESFGDRFSRAVTGRVERALSGLPEASIRVGLAPNEFDQGIDRVRADLAALRDVRVGVDVSADEALARVNDLRDRVSRLSREAERMRGRGISVDADTLRALGELTGLRRELTALQREAERPVRVPEPELGEFERAFQQRVVGALRSLPEARLRVDDTDAGRALSRIREQLADIAGRRVGVDVDAASALTELGVVRAALDDIGQSTVDPQVRVDTARAVAQLAALQEQIDRVSRVEVEPPPVGEFERAFTQRLAGALRALPPVELTLDSTPADRALDDLRGQMEALSGRRVGVDVDAADALARLGAVRVALEGISQSTANPQVRVDTARAAAQLAGLQEQIDRLGPAVIEVPPPEMGEFERTLRRRVSAAIRSLPEINVDADTTDADIALAAIRAEMVSLSEQRIGVDLDDSLALAQIRRLRDELEALGADTASPRIQLDTAQAAAQLAALDAQLDRVSGDTARVTVDADTSAADSNLNAMQANAATARIGLLALGVAGLSLGPAVAAGAGVAAAALATIGTGAVAGVGVMALGLSGVGAAVTALGAAQEQAGQSAASFATRQMQVAGALDGVRNAQRNLANVRAQAADSAVRAAERVASAERALRRAQEDVTRAQERLTEARREARRELEDMAIAAAGGALAERQAVLDLARAQEELDAARANPGLDPRDRAQIEIDYERAQLNLERQRTENQRLAEDRRRADAAGVEGSARVRAAQDQVRGATERVADAQRDLAGAVRDQAAQARQSANQIASAQAAVVAAQRAVRQASISAGQAGGAAMRQLRTAMDDLSPAGQRFARFIFGLRPELNALRFAAQEGFLPGLQAGIEALLPYRPQVEGFVRAIADLLGGMAARLGQELTDPFWRDFFSLLAEVALPTLTDMFEMSLNIAEGFAGILAAFVPLGVDMSGGLVDLTERWAEFGRTAGENPQVRAFIDYIRENGPVVLSVVGEVVAAVVRLVVALAPIGELIIGALMLLAQGIQALPVPVLSGLIAVIGALATGFWILTAATAAWTAVMAANPVVLIIVGIIALVTALVVAYRTSERFRNVVNTVFRAVAAAATWLWERVLRPAFDGIRYAITEWVIPAALWLWERVLRPVFRAISDAAVDMWEGTLRPIFDRLVDLVRDQVGPIVMWLWQTIVRPAFGGIVLLGQGLWAVLEPILRALWWFISTVLGPVILWLWRNVVGPAFQAIGVIIQASIAIVQVALGLLLLGLRGLGAVFEWLWRNIVVPVWNGISSAIRTVWETLIRPVFNAIADIIEDHVAPKFEAGVEAIGAAWETIRDIAKAPVRFVIETVLNNGIIRAYNWIADKFGIDEIRPIPLPQGFASGGVYPGYTPGRDIGLAAVSGGEAIMRPEWTRAVGRQYVEDANRAARTGGVEGARRFLAETGGPPLVGGYWVGGVVDALTDPVGWFRRQVEGPLRGIREFADSDYVEMIAKLPVELVDGAIDRIGDWALGWLPDFLGGGERDVVRRDLGNTPHPTLRRQAGVTSYPAIINFMRRSGIPFNVSSTYRRTSNTWHGRGNAVDSYSSAVGMAQMARWLYQFSPYLLELLHSGGNSGRGFFVKNGRRVGRDFYSGEIASHYNHVHVAATNPAIAAANSVLNRPETRQYDSGGYLPTGLSLAYNATGRPEPVLNDAQWEAMMAAARRGGDGDTTINLFGATMTTAEQVEHVSAAVGWRGRTGTGRR